MNTIQKRALHTTQYRAFCTIQRRAVSARRWRAVRFVQKSLLVLFVLTMLGAAAVRVEAARRYDVMVQGALDVELQRSGGGARNAFTPGYYLSRLKRKDYLPKKPGSMRYQLTRPAAMPMASTSSTLIFSMVVLGLPAREGNSKR
jgi:hypothetical protein